MSDYTVTPICLGGIGPDVLGQYDPRERWNGWLCPRIDALSVVLVVDAINEAGPEYGYDYDWQDDGALVLTDRQFRDEDPTNYVPEILPADADGLYDLGAYGWVWCESDEEVTA